MTVARVRMEFVGYGVSFQDHFERVVERDVDDRVVFTVVNLVRNSDAVGRAGRRRNPVVIRSASAVRGSQEVAGEGARELRGDERAHTVAVSRQPRTIDPWHASE